MYVCVEAACDLPNVQVIWHDAGRGELCRYVELFDPITGRRPPGLGPDPPHYDEERHGLRVRVHPVPAAIALWVRYGKPARLDHVLRGPWSWRTKLGVGWVPAGPRAGRVAS
jgi:hypothetical protein